MEKHSRGRPIEYDDEIHRKKREAARRCLLRKKNPSIIPIKIGRPRKYTDEKHKRNREAAHRYLIRKKHPSICFKKQKVGRPKKHRFRSYDEVLAALETKPDTPRIITCRLCGEPMHMIRINKIVAFWIHRGESIVKCGKLNTLFPGKPVVAQDLTFYRNILSTWNNIVSQQKIVREEK